MTCSWIPRDTLWRDSDVLRRPEVDTQPDNRYRLGNSEKMTSFRANWLNKFALQNLLTVSQWQCLLSLPLLLPDCSTWPWRSSMRPRWLLTPRSRPRTRQRPRPVRQQPAQQRGRFALEGEHLEVRQSVVFLHDHDEDLQLLLESSSGLLGSDWHAQACQILLWRLYDYHEQLNLVSKVRQLLSRAQKCSWMKNSFFCMKQLKRTSGKTFFRVAIQRVNCNYENVCRRSHSTTKVSL